MTAKNSMEIYKTKLDEVVVTALKNKQLKSGSANTETVKFPDNETIRVLNKLSKIYIEKFKGKSVAIPVRYILK
jgi:hypothetical protein